MIKNYRKHFCTFIFVCCFNIVFAQQIDSLFNDNTVVKILYTDKSDKRVIQDYINDTASWNANMNIGLGDLKSKNQLLLKTAYYGNEYENPAIVLIGLSSGFEIYRDSVRIYAAGKKFNPDNPCKYFDTHIIPLEKPLSGSVFVIRIQFKSYLDITFFSTALIGENAELAKLAKEHSRHLQQSKLGDFVLGIFLLIAGFLALAAFILRLKNKDWLLFWFFLFAASQGYVFMMNFLMMLVNLSPTFIMVSTVIVENLVPIGIIGIIAMITGFSKNFFVRLLISLHIIYTALHLSLIHFDIYNILFWILVFADIIMFLVALLKSKIYRNPDFKIPVIAICT